MTGSVFLSWGALAMTLLFLYRAWVEWRRAGRTRLAESSLLVAFIALGIVLRSAPDMVRNAHSALTGVAAAALLWRDRRTFSRRDPLLWLGGAAVALLVILEINHDVSPFMSTGASRLTLLLFVAVTAAFIATPIVQLTRLTMEARQVIAEARAMLKARKDSEDRSSNVP